MWFLSIIYHRMVSVEEKMQFNMSSVLEIECTTKIRNATSGYTHYKVPITGRMSQNDDVIKWKHFPRYWPFVEGIHWLPVNSPHKGPWRGALMFSLVCAWIKGWVNNREAGDPRRHRVHYDVTLMGKWVAVATARQEGRPWLNMVWDSTIVWFMTAKFSSGIRLSYFAIKSDRMC